MSKQIIQLLDNLSQDEFRSFINLLSKKEFDYLQAELLFKMKNSASEKIFSSMKPEFVFDEKNVPLSSENELLNSIHSKLILSQLHALNKESVELLLTQLHKSELVIILSILQKSTDEVSKLILARIEEALAAKEKKNPLMPQADENEYQQFWRTRFIKWMPDLWNEVYDKLTHVREESLQSLKKPPVITDAKEFEKENTKKTAPAPSKSLLGRYAWSGDDYFTERLTPLSNEFQNKAPPKSSAEENRTFAALVSSSALHEERYIDKSSDRARANRERVAHIRFGATISSQANVGARGNYSLGPILVVRSLLQMNDGDNEQQNLFNSIEPLILRHDLLAQKNMFFTGGFSSLITSMEAEDLNEILNSDSIDKYGIKFSQEERRRIEEYKSAIFRSRDINFAIASNFNLGQYKKNSYEPIDDKEEFSKLSQKFENNLTIIGKKIIEQCDLLKEGETIFLDSGILFHAMKIAITVKNGNFELTCYDSAGGLEDSVLREQVSGLLKLSALGKEGKRSNALKFTIPRTQLLSEGGLSYFRGLLRQHSLAGHLEADKLSKERPLTRADKILNYFVNTSKLDPDKEIFFGARLLIRFAKFLDKKLGLSSLAAGRGRSKLYLTYIDAFTSIADPNSPPFFVPLEQHSQNTWNCFAKRMQTCQLYELGKPTYKKIRKAILVEQRDKTLDDILGATAGERQQPLFNPEYQFMFENLQTELLSPEELFEASIQLSEITTLSPEKAPVPSAEYYTKFFKSLLDARFRLLLKFNRTDNEQFALKRIEDKLDKYAREFHQYLLDHGKEERIAQVFTHEFRMGSFDWRSEREPFNIPKGTRSDNSEAIKQLSEFAAATAWRSSILINNHMILKLSVKERHIENNNERLARARLFETRSITFKDIQEANIVSFTKGMGRKEVIQVEININGTRKEIDKRRFFKLVASNKEALADAKVMDLLDYLRNISLETEQQYQDLVYPVQRTVLEKKLQEQIVQTDKEIKQGIKDLSEYEQKLQKLLDRSLNLQAALEKEITPLQERADSTKRFSMELNDLKEQLRLIKRDTEHIRDLQSAVLNQKTKLEATGEHSIQSRVDKSRSLLSKLNNGATDKRAIKHIMNDYRHSESDLSAIRMGISVKWQELEHKNVEEKLVDRETHIKEYCVKVLQNNLNVNPEYRIIQELALGNLGSEKDRDPLLYRRKSNDAEPVKRGYKKDSLLFKIQNLNKKIQDTILRQYTRELTSIVSNNTKEQKEQGLIEEHKEYSQIVAKAKELTSKSISPEIKKEWVEQIVQIWLEHEKTSLLSELFKPQIKSIEHINQAFHHFIEQNTDIKLAALQHAGFDLILSPTQIAEIAWHPEKIAEQEEAQEKAAHVIITKYKERFAQKELKSTVPEAPIDINAEQVKKSIISAEDIESPVINSEVYLGFSTPKVQFLSREDREAADSNTLKFLKKNKAPLLMDKSKSGYKNYLEEISQYIDKLIAYKGLENKKERLIELGISVSNVIAPLEYSSDAAITRKLIKTLIDLYRDEHSSIDECFMLLENAERSQLLSTILKLSISTLRTNAGEKIRINPEFYSIIKHWERLVIPQDPILSQMVRALASDPSGAIPEEFELLQEIDTAIHLSPIGLEGIYEGQQGLQIALSTYGMESGIYDEKSAAYIKENGCSQLREIADALLMRNGDSLLAAQFIKYYENKLILYSKEGIHSTQGREFFARAFIDAFQQATTEERKSLIKFLRSIKSNEACPLKSKDNLFCAELLLKCHILDSIVAPIITLADVTVSKSVIEQSIIEQTDSNKGEDRLLGFAKAINFLAIQIEEAKVASQNDKLDKLYSRLICTNLAYQLLLDQADDQARESYSKNFEYKKEMSQVQTNINNLQDSLLDFSNNINMNTRDKTFKQIFNEYQKEKKFDGTPIQLVKVQSSDIPGFISLGGLNSLDVLHGAVYVGNNRKGVMPAHIQAHSSLQVLGLDKLTFKPEAGGYIYTKDGVEKASVTQTEEGSLVTQRELETLDGTNKMLQYLSPEYLSSLPTAIKTRINAEHFFIDERGAIHAFSSDFKPIMKITLNDKQWIGEFIDHQKEKMSIIIDVNELTNDTTTSLSQLFPYEEMINIDKNIVYIPALQKYVTHIGNEHDFYLRDSLSENSPVSRLKIEKGIGYTVKTLTAADNIEIDKLRKDIKKYEQENRAIENAQLDSLVASYRSQKLQENINRCLEQIHQIESHECFIFLPEDGDIRLQEQRCDQLLARMNDAYIDTVKGGLDKDKMMMQYEKAKTEYLTALKELRKSLAHANHKIIYSVSRNGAIVPKDFQGVLSLGRVEGSTQIFLNSLGNHLPKKPLLPSELEDLRVLRREYEQKSVEDPKNQFILCMLVGIELKHMLLEREQSLQGKANHWDKTLYEQLKEDFSRYVLATKENRSESFPVLYFNELWREIKSEFHNDKLLSELDEIISIKQVEPVYVPTEPLNISKKTTTMPIETLNLVSMVICKAHKQLDIDEEQRELISLLEAFPQSKESTRAQIDGFYYENFGVFDANPLLRFFKITADKPGVGKLNQTDIIELFELMKQWKWIEQSELAGKFQLTKHPSEFFSLPQVEAFFSEKGLAKNDIKHITQRLEVFLYETAVKGVQYEIALDKIEELKEKLSAQQVEYELEILMAETKIKALVSNAFADIPMSELYAAYLLNDYSKILVHFPEEERPIVQRSMNNALTRMMYYKTELDHLNDIKGKVQENKYEEAISMLHIKRNYSLEKLLGSADSTYEINTDEDKLAAEQDRKMQRAFLIFESEFGHRCNARQVDIFRGLLLDDETDPDKIDSAQARMGFGKTTLLPLIALYKTGNNKLVRFIVPKSALETNTEDMSFMLERLVGSRAVKDDFRRYQLAHDPEAGMDEKSPRLQSLRDAKADLIKRLDLYKRVRDNGEVLVQAPHVRNAIECQTKIFLKLLSSLENEPEQEKELMACISLINAIRSIETISIFDELDATQDLNTTDVNYTAGEKLSFNPQEIQPLELITQIIRSAPDKNVNGLAEAMLAQFGIVDTPDSDILKYITSSKVTKPKEVNFENETPIYLMRAVLTDPSLLSVFIEKQPSADFGVWYENSSTGEKIYDYISVDSETETDLKQPLLIAVPYSAANTPKPQGSRFDNPEVTAITTFLYYLDSRTAIEEVPHLEFLLSSLKTSDIETALSDSAEGMSPEFEVLFRQIKEIADIEDVLTRNKVRSEFFKKYLSLQAEDSSIQFLFRRMLARTIIKEQIKIDTGKATSNRYELATINDQMKGFSGTEGDTSFHFKQNRPDPAADGNMTFGIMGRKNCQKTQTLITKDVNCAGFDYTTMLIKQIFNPDSLDPNTRAFIDVGGLCKATNREVARIIALQLQAPSCPIKNNKGVIFYDDVTNTKKLLRLDPDGEEIIQDLTAEMVKESEEEGCYVTSYDHAHARGANIKQKDGAHAVLSLSFTVTNNDYKQAIMRMRKIIDKASGQSFSLVVPDSVREKIITDLELPSQHILTGNDIAYWLRSKELLENANVVSTIKLELESVIKNAVIEQQGRITQLFSEREQELNTEEIAQFRSFVKELDHISSLIAEDANSLEAKYGQVFGEISKEDFVKREEEKFKDKLSDLFDIVRRVREVLKLPLDELNSDKPYEAQKDSILEKRVPALSDTFLIPSSSGKALAEAHVEVESHAQNQRLNQQQNQNQVQSQSHSLSQVNQEEVIGSPALRKPGLVEPVSISFLSSQKETEALIPASKMHPIKYLFADSDSIKCSKVYQQLYDTKKIIPPVRYFISREVGEPKIILLNQDEANLFKKSDNSSWSLYDLQLANQEQLTPIHGKAIHFDEVLLKKLYFASYHYAAQGDNLNEIQESLNSICTAEQIIPSMIVNFTNDGELIEDSNSLFSLSEWGFKGNKSQMVEFSIEQTHKNFDGGGVKEGVTLHLGDNAEIFISSRLNNHLLEALDKPAEPTQSKLRIMKEAIEARAKFLIGEKERLGSNIALLKRQKGQITIDAQKQIAELEQEREQLIEAAKAKVPELLKQKLEVALNLRKTIAAQMRYDVQMDCQTNVGITLIKGISTDNGLVKKFGSLREIFNTKLTNLAQTYPTMEHALANKETIETDLNAFLENVSSAAIGMYNSGSQYFKKDQPFINVFKAELEDQIARNKDAKKGKKKTIDQLRVWDSTLEQHVNNHFISIIQGAPNGNDLRSELLKFLKEAAEECREKGNTQELESILVEKFKAFAAAHNLGEMVVSAFLSKLSSSLCIQEKDKYDKYDQRVKEEIQNILISILLKRAGETAPDFVPLLTEVLNNKIKNSDPTLPDALIHGITPAEEEMKNFISGALQLQGVRTTEYCIKELTKTSINLKEQSQVMLQQILENYFPVDKDKPRALVGADGKPMELSGDYLQLITQLDENVARIDAQLGEVIQGREDNLRRIDSELNKSIPSFRAVCEEFKVLRGIRAACNKLFAKLDDLLPTFLKRQVSIKSEEEADPALFLERHFNLKEIINNKREASAELTFIPPEFYKVMDDMTTQRTYMHDFVAEEENISANLIAMRNVVEREAAVVKLREQPVQLVLEDDITIESEFSEDEINELSDGISESDDGISSEGYTTSEEHSPVVSVRSKHYSFFKEKPSDSRSENKPSVINIKNG